MKLCFSGQNLTIGIVRIKTSNAVVVSEKKLSGLIGDILQRHFQLHKKK